MQPGGVDGGGPKAGVGRSDGGSRARPVHPHTNRTHLEVSVALLARLDHRHIVEHHKLAEVEHLGAQAGQRGGRAAHRTQPRQRACQLLLLLHVKGGHLVQLTAQRALKQGARGVCGCAWGGGRGRGGVNARDGRRAALGAPQDEPRAPPCSSLTPLLHIGLDGVLERLVVNVRVLPAALRLGAQALAKPHGCRRWCRWVVAALARALLLQRWRCCLWPARRAGAGEGGAASALRLLPQCLNAPLGSCLPLRPLASPPRSPCFPGSPAGRGGGVRS